MKKLNIKDLKVSSFVTKDQGIAAKGGESNNRSCYFDSDPYCEDTVTVYYGTCLYPC